MKVLNLANTDLTKDFPKGTEISTERADGPFDIIVARHLLSTLQLQECVDALKELIELLVPGGQLHLAEPSAEYVAQEIKAHRLNQPLMLHVFGDGKTARRNICTLVEIREMGLLAGFHPMDAQTRPYVVAKDDLGNEFPADQHYVVFVRPIYYQKEAKAWTAD